MESIKYIFISFLKYLEQFEQFHVKFWFKTFLGFQNFQD